MADVAETESTMNDDGVTDADLEAGFDEVAKEPSATPEPQTDQSTTPAASSEAQAVTEAPKFVQITEKDWSDLKTELTTLKSKTDAAAAELERKVSKAFGTLGGMERAFKEMQAATPAGKPVEITEAMSQALMKDFPEVHKGTIEMMRGLIDQINLKGTAVKAPPVTAPPTVAFTEADVAKRTEEAAAIAELKVVDKTLEGLHPGWRKLTGASANPDPNHPFRKWAAALPKEQQDELNITKDPLVMSRYIQGFEAAQKKSAANANSSKRVAQLRDATQPKGDGGPAARVQPKQDEFEAGFEEESRARRSG